MKALALPIEMVRDLVIASFVQYGGAATLIFQSYGTFILKLIIINIIPNYIH
jgi:hypothetical protein